MLRNANVLGLLDLLGSIKSYPISKECKEEGFPKCLRGTKTLLVITEEIPVLVLQSSWTDLSDRFETQRAPGFV